MDDRLCVSPSSCFGVIGPICCIDHRQPLRDRQQNYQSRHICGQDPESVLHEVFPAHFEFLLVKPIRFAKVKASRSHRVYWNSLPLSDQGQEMAFGHCPNKKNEFLEKHENRQKDHRTAVPVSIAVKFILSPKPRPLQFAKILTHTTQFFMRNSCFCFTFI